MRALVGHPPNALLLAADECGDSGLGLPVRSVIITLVTRSFLPGLRRRLLGMAVGPYRGFRVPPANSPRFSSDFSVVLR
jgi:hypothetical protein